MYSKKRIDTIRKMKCILFKGMIERQHQTHCECFNPRNPSFFIEWDKDAGQFKILPSMYVIK